MRKSTAFWMVIDYINRVPTKVIAHKFNVNVSTVTKTAKKFIWPCRSPGEVHGKRVSPRKKQFDLFD